MGELRTLKRGPSNPVRRRTVQGRLSIPVVEDEAAKEVSHGEAARRGEGFRRPARQANRAKRALSPAPVFHPLAYRSVIAGWSIASREQWGRRANELEATGLSWRDAEAQAFVEVWHRVRHLDAEAVSAPDPPLDPFDVDEADFHAL